jgi:hypothetical protein
MGAQARRLAEQHGFSDTVDRLMAVYKMLHLAGLRSNHAPGRL